MKIDIVFSDIDGTLLDSEKRLSDTTIDTFERIKDKTPIVLISSRMPSAMYHLQKSANIDHFPTIAYNGGLIIHDKKDRIIPYKDGLKFKQNYHNAKFISTKGFGHGLKSDVVYNHILEFLNA